MAETVNTSALLLSDGQGGYSKAFVESMSDIVKLSDGSTLTEKLTEIDGKLPITLESGSLPETLKFGQMAVNEDGSFYVGDVNNSPVSFNTSSVLTVDMAPIQLRLLLDMCIRNRFVPDLPVNVFVDLATVSESEITIVNGNWSSIHGVY